MGSVLRQGFLASLGMSLARRQNLPYRESFTCLSKKSAIAV